MVILGRDSCLFVGVPEKKKRSPLVPRKESYENGMFSIYSVFFLNVFIVINLKFIILIQMKCVSSGLSFILQNLICKQ